MSIYYDANNVLSIEFLLLILLSIGWFLLIYEGDNLWYVTTKIHVTKWNYDDIGIEIHVRVVFMSNVKNEVVKIARQSTCVKGLIGFGED